VSYSRWYLSVVGQSVHQQLLAKHLWKYGAKLNETSQETSLCDPPLTNPTAKHRDWPTTTECND